jgi:hypothetical protein
VNRENCVPQSENNGNCLLVAVHFIAAHAFAFSFS